MPLIFPNCDTLGCTEKAQWSIYLPDSFSHACTRHVGDQLNPGLEHSIMPAVPDPLFLKTPPELEALLGKLRQRFSDLEQPGRV